MRVIAGRFKGQRLTMPKGIRIRPSSQILKAALFSILGEKIIDAYFLELFAGSGNIGIEALSRGAKQVIFADNQRLCIKTIEDNLKHLGIGHCYTIAKQDLNRQVGAVLLFLDAERTIELLYQNKQKFDFVFLDPPYGEDKLKNCLIKIGQYDILKPHSFVISEHNKRESLPYLFAGLKVSLTKRYGDSALSFYQKG